MIRIAMTEQKKTIYTKCPHWSPHSLKCRICKGGLFIPLDDHIDVFCTTSNYPQCLQYAMHTATDLQVVTPEEDQNNRRQFLRIEATYRITMVKSVQTGEILSHLSTEATTLDLSMGGMRICSQTPVRDSSLMHFSFDESFPDPLQDGIGEVMWCNKQIDEPGYQAGIMFHDEMLVEAMGHYLGTQFGRA